MKFNGFKKLVKEDFDSKDQALIEKLAFVFNPLIEQLVQAFNKNVDFDNLNQEIIYLNTKVNATGVPILGTDVKTTLKTRLKGIQCISALNLTDTLPPAGAPFVTYTVSSNLIKITNITGLLPNKDYQLTLILIG